MGSVVCEIVRREALLCSVDDCAAVLPVALYSFYPAGLHQRIECGRNIARVVLPQAVDEFEPSVRNLKLLEDCLANLCCVSCKLLLSPLRGLRLLMQVCQDIGGLLARHLTNLVDHSLSVRLLIVPARDSFPNPPRHDLAQQCGRYLERDIRGGRNIHTTV